MHARLHRRQIARDRLRAIVLLAFVVASVAAYAVERTLNADPAVDAKTSCLVSGPPPATELVLVDTTDALSAAQADSVFTELREHIAVLPQYGRLMLMFLDAQHPYEPQLVLSLCNPGAAKDFGWFFHTPRRVDARWRSAYAAPATAALASLLHKPTAPNSPIMAAITGATWRRDFDVRVPRRSLVLVSDLLEHDPRVFTTYRRGDVWARFAASGLPEIVKANLSSVSVRVLILHRPSALHFQTENLVALWRRWFLERGAASIEFGDTLPSESNSARLAQNDKESGK